jgi:hypothetical protein
MDPKRKKQIEDAVNNGLDKGQKTARDLFGKAAEAAKQAAKKADDALNDAMAPQDYHKQQEETVAPVEPPTPKKRPPRRFNL